MSASFIKLLLFFSICCTLNGGAEGYRFINNLTETEIMDMDLTIKIDASLHEHIFAMRGYMDLVYPNYSTTG